MGWKLMHAYKYLHILQHYEWSDIIEQRMKIDWNTFLEYLKCTIEFLILIGHLSEIIMLHSTSQPISKVIQIFCASAGKLKRLT